MSEEEDVETQLMALNLSETISITSFVFGKGEIFSQGHTCPNPEHASDTVIPIVVIQVTDEQDKEHTLIFPRDSSLTREFAEMDMYYKFKRMLEA